jgi:ABC-type amino acid transport substrate-binding protein
VIHARAEKLIHVLFSRRTKDDENTRDDFHRGLQQILADGTMQQILEKQRLDDMISRI